MTTQTYDDTKWRLVPILADGKRIAQREQTPVAFMAQRNSVLKVPSR